MAFANGTNTNTMFSVQVAPPFFFLPRFCIYIIIMFRFYWSKQPEDMRIKEEAFFQATAIKFAITPVVGVVSLVS